MKKIFMSLLILTSILFSHDKEYSYRKYSHVYNFYRPLIESTVALSLKYNMPPAAILAIASIESGYGRGYVASITGNILSLGAGKSDKELPSLYLPNTKNPYKVLYNPVEIKHYLNSNLSWKQREKSLKKDYRPNSISGTSKELEYFDNNKEDRIQANLKNMEDFSTKWISVNNRYKAFSQARTMLEEQVSKYGKDILFSKKLNIAFINQIGGKKNSFNYRKSWPKKVIMVLNKTGMISLCQNIYRKKEFDTVW